MSKDYYRMSEIYDGLNKAVRHIENLHVNKLTYNKVLRNIGHTSTLNIQLYYN